jgi:hypothetical protein
MKSEVDISVTPTRLYWYDPFDHVKIKRERERDRETATETETETDRDRDRAHLSGSNPSVLALLLCPL